MPTGIWNARSSHSCPLSACDWLGKGNTSSWAAGLEAAFLAILTLVKICWGWCPPAVASAARCSRCRRGHCCPCPALYYTFSRFQSCITRLWGVRLCGLGECNNACGLTFRGAYVRSNSYATAGISRWGRGGGFSQWLVLPAYGIQGILKGRLSGCCGQGVGNIPRHTGQWAQARWGSAMVTAAAGFGEPTLVVLQPSRVPPSINITLSSGHKGEDSYGQLSTCAPDECGGWMASTSAMPASTMSHRPGRREGGYVLLEAAIRFACIMYLMDRRARPSNPCGCRPTR